MTFSYGELITLLTWAKEYIGDANGLEDDKALAERIAEEVARIDQKYEDVNR